MQDHYKTLGVKRNATQQEVKDAYRGKAKENHPDKHGGDEQLFKILSNAYTVLVDPDRRKFYDDTGSEMKPGEFERKADALLQQLFQLIVSQNGLEKIIHLDIIMMMNQQIDKGMTELKKKIDKAKRSKAETEKILKRLKHKNKNNPISAMLKHEIQKHSESITQTRQEMEVGRRSRKILKDYSFDFEEQMQVVNPLYAENFKTHTITFTGT
jgi:curved DNA-binding protein CbpA